MNENYYSTLLIKKDATNEEIKDAYRDLIKFYHPDNNADLSKKQIDEYEEKLNLINEAYSILSDKDKRATYDKFLLAPNVYNGLTKTKKTHIYDEVRNWYKKYENCDIDSVEYEYGNYFYNLAKKWENKDFVAKVPLRKNQILGFFFLIIIVFSSLTLYLNSDTHKTNILVKELQKKNKYSIYRDKWVNSNGEWNYYDINGKVAVNRWIQYGNDWYYLGEYGEIVKNKFIDNDYYVGEDGKMVVNHDVKNNENGYWYYFGADGKKITNDSVTRDGIVYTYGPDGKLLYWWDSKNSNVGGASY